MIQVCAPSCENCLLVCEYDLVVGVAVSSHPHLSRAAHEVGNSTQDSVDGALAQLQQEVKVLREDVSKLLKLSGGTQTRSWAEAASQQSRDLLEEVIQTHGRARSVSTLGPVGQL